VVILDIRMPGRSGLDGLPDFKSLLPGAHIIMITAFHDMETTIEAMQKGAEDYIHKPIDIDELDAAIEKLQETEQHSSDLHASTNSEPLSTAMIGRSRGMKEVFKTIGLVAKSPATVLISGESGTGKELVARAIHRSGHNPDGPFVVVNCAAVVETLLESDMFGHEKGAFTGALNRQVGKFALAHGGTIFLDEVGEMSPGMQAKLLRVLQYKEFTPLGARQAETTDARIIAATNEDLAEKVSKGQFREDLFYRLRVVNIHLPPLRERAEDLRDLVQFLLGRINRDLRRNVQHIKGNVLAAFEAYAWPGNVRELENALMKAVALSPGDTLSLDLFEENIRKLSSTGESNVHANGEERRDGLLSLAEIEKRHVLRVLESVDWHKGKACEILGVSRPRLRRMLKDCGIEASEADSTSSD
jgi:DNA-binding NtrC family response regulator